MITPSQQTVIDDILRIWAAGKQFPHGAAGVRPRPYPLIVGRSGTGKSTIAQALGEHLDCPVFSVSSGSWILRAAREESQSHTLNQLKGYIERNSSGIIFIDELDKFTGTGDWCRCVGQELYALLDLDRYRLGWDERHILAFRTSFCLLLAGTWQDLRPPSTMGFNGCVESLDLVRHQNSIPDELLRRCYHPAIFLPETTREEFATVLAQVHSELGISEDIDRLTVSAAESGLNMRWVQNYVSGVLAARTAPLRLTPHCIDFSANGSSWDLHECQATEPDSFITEFGSLTSNAVYKDEETPRSSELATGIKQSRKRSRELQRLSVRKKSKKTA